MKFRLPTYDDYEIMKEYVIEHYSNHEKSISASEGLTNKSFKEWVDKANKDSNVPDPVWGKNYLYLAFNEENTLVGLLNIRFELNEELLNRYGHIGYGVRPSQRRKGYATKMLKYALELCKEKGLNEAILGCHKQNIGSNKVIQNCGGVLYRTDTESMQLSDAWTIELINNYYKIEL